MAEWAWFFRSRGSCRGAASRTMCGSPLRMRVKPRSPLCSQRLASPSIAPIFPANSRLVSRDAPRWRAPSPFARPLLLLDEPFVSLDAPLARQLQRDLAKLVETRGMITVLVTHDVDEAIALADRIFVLSARPARVVGEIRVASPRAGMSSKESQAIVARIEALREAG